MATRNRNVSWFRKEKTAQEVYHEYLKEFGYKPQDVKHLMAFGKKHGTVLSYEVAKTLIDEDGQMNEPDEHKSYNDANQNIPDALITAADLQNSGVAIEMQGKTTDNKNSIVVSLAAPDGDIPINPNTRNSAVSRKSTQGSNSSGKAKSPPPRSRKKTVPEPESIPVHIQIYNVVNTMNHADIKTSDIHQMEIEKSSLREHFKAKDVELFQDDLLDILLQDFHSDIIKPLDFSKWKNTMTLPKIEEITAQVSKARKERMLQGGYEYLFRRLKVLAINEMDQDSDQQITREEFCAKFSHEVPEEMLDMVFRTIDVNNDDSITPLEFHRWKNNMTLKKLEEMIAEQKARAEGRSSGLRLSVIQTRSRMPSELAELRDEEKEKRTSILGELKAVDEDKNMDQEDDDKEMTLQDLEKRKLQESHRKQRVPVGLSLFDSKTVVVEVREHSLDVHDMHHVELEDALLGKNRAPQRIILDAESYLLKYGFYDKRTEYTMIPVTKYPIITLDLEIPLQTFQEKESEYSREFAKLLEVNVSDIVMLAADKHELMDGFCTIHFIMCRMEPEWKALLKENEAKASAKVEEWLHNKLAPLRRSFKDEVWLVRTLRDLDFQKLDGDNNHRIDYPEFKEYIANESVEKLLECVYDRLFRDLDENGDGEINPREFLLWKQSYTVKKLLQMFPITYIHAYLHYNCAPADIDLKVKGIREYIYKCMQYVPFDFEIDCITYCYNKNVSKTFSKLEEYSENTRIMFDHPVVSDISSIAFYCYNNRNREFSTYYSGGDYGQGHYFSTNCEYVMNQMIGTERLTEEETELEKESLEKRYALCTCAVNTGKVEVLTKRMRGQAIPRRLDSYYVESIDGKWGSDTFASISTIGHSVGASANTAEVDAHSVVVDQFVIKDAKRILPMFVVHMKRKKQHFLWSDQAVNAEECVRSMISKRIKLSKEIPDKIYCCLTFRDLSRTIELKQVKSKRVSIMAMTFLQNDDREEAFLRGVKEEFENADKMVNKMPVQIFKLRAQALKKNKLQWTLHSNDSNIGGTVKKVFRNLKKNIQDAKDKVIIVTVRVET